MCGDVLVVPTLYNANRNRWRHKTKKEYSEKEKKLTKKDCESQKKEKQTMKEDSERQLKYNHEFYDKFLRVLYSLPVCAVVNQHVFCCHASIESCFNMLVFQALSISLF